MAVGDQDHGRIAMAVAAMLAGTVHQPLNLALGEVSPLDCQVYDAWCAFLGCRFHADKPCLRLSVCYAYTRLLHSQIELRFMTGREINLLGARTLPRQGGMSHLRDPIGLDDSLVVLPGQPPAIAAATSVAASAAMDRLRGALPDPVRDGGTP